ncbi:MAG: membrane protein insertase YidC [Steroidobacteraceae bacterium]|jgi:YidC/Oxa1 family membrane protein insertase|nr:membrane protein insertase YidC [Steroidobacteraceae bacterium]
MDNQRVFVWAALALVLWLNYLAWQRDYAPPAAPPAPAATASEEMRAEDDASLPDLPKQAADATAASAEAEQPTAEPQDEQIIRVTTDVLSMDISSRGGSLVRAELLKYPKEKNRPEDPVQLFTPSGPGYFVARSGLRAAEGRAQPTHLEPFQSESTEFRLEPGQEKLVVPLTWSDGQGLTVTKTYTFRPGSYRIDVNYHVSNQTDQDWSAASYVQIVRHWEPIERSYFHVDTYAYRGPAIYDGKGYRRLDVEDEEERVYQNTIKGGWIAALQHHFVAAAVPPEDAVYDYRLNVDQDQNYTLSYRGPLIIVPASQSKTFSETLFVGPKLQDQLAATGPRLELVADYGRLTVISEPLFWLLEKVHSVVGNWGWAIVIVTFLIKLAFYKLTAASGRSMAKMRNLAPRIKALQERYKDDREQLGKQMMELYKREKINPLAGCLPILIQIPFFLAFYWVLLESVEMRQAPFLGWITDLSSRDPFFILPLLMGAAMFAQFKLQPMPSADPIQAKIFMFMPIVMAVMMAWFPAGLVLYWLTNTLLSIAQQWRINKLVAAEQKKT